MMSLFLFKYWRQNGCLKIVKQFCQLFSANIVIYFETDGAQNNLINVVASIITMLHFLSQKYILYFWDCKVLLFPPTLTTAPKIMVQSMYGSELKKVSENMFLPELHSNIYIYLSHVNKLCCADILPSINLHTIHFHLRKHNCCHVG